MSLWHNFVVITAPRNGTTTHTVDPSSATGVVAGAPFTPTAGRALLVVAGGAATSTTPSGWTLPTSGSAINNAGLYRWHKASASGGDTITTTHNGSDYAVHFAFFEFPAGTTFGACVSATGANWTVANPTLSGLTGTNVVMGAATEGNTSPSTAVSATWGSPDVEVVDVNALKVGTDGCWLGVAYQDAYASSTYAPVPTITNVGTLTERLTWSINIPLHTVSDDFNRADQSPIGVPWIKAFGNDARILGNALGHASANDTFYYYAGAAASADQFAEASETATGITGHDWGPAVRVAPAAQTGYFAEPYGGSLSFAKEVGGAYTLMTSGSLGATYVQDGAHPMRIEAQGTTLRAYYNGALLATLTDTSISSGQPGLFIYDADVSGTQGGIDNWSGGDLITAPTVKRPSDRRRRLVLPHRSQRGGWGR